MRISKRNKTKKMRSKLRSYKKSKQYGSSTYNLNNTKFGFQNNTTSGYGFTNNSGFGFPPNTHQLTKNKVNRNHKNHLDKDLLIT